jgi:hypothetical protein
MTPALPRAVRSAINRASHQHGMRQEELERERLLAEAETLLAGGMSPAELCTRLGVPAREGDGDE